MAATVESMRVPKAAARSHRYYIGMSVTFIVLILLGFSQRYYARLSGLEHATPVVHVHAAIFSAWFLLLLAQTSLVAADRRDLHRRLGVAGAALLPLMLVVGLTTAIEAARAGWNPAGMPNGVLTFLALGIFDTLLFAAFAAAALWYRKAPEIHKRLIILASVSLLWAAITRLPQAMGMVVVPNPPPAAALAGCFVLFLLLALSGPLYDVCSRRRVQGLEVSAGLLIVAGRPLTRAVANTEGWQVFGTWLLR